MKSIEALFLMNAFLLHKKAHGKLGNFNDWIDAASALEINEIDEKDHVTHSSPFSVRTHWLAVRHSFTEF